MKPSFYIRKDERLSKIFKDIDLDEIDIYTNTRIYEKGERLTNKGDKSTKLLFVHKGDMKIVNEFASGLNYTKMQLKSLVLIGHIEILAHEEIIANTIIAESKCIAIEMSKIDFLRIIKTNQSFSLNINELLAKDFYNTIINQGEHLLNSSLYKLIKLFINIADVVFLEDTFINECTIEETKKNMSEKIGVSERTVNRNIRKLKEDEYIIVRNRKIIITKAKYVMLKEYLETL